MQGLRDCGSCEDASGLNLDLIVTVRFRRYSSSRAFLLWECSRLNSEDQENMTTPNESIHVWTRLRDCFDSIYTWEKMYQV